ncbi:versican core protein [Elysia marginata]|uniref:Versican core protein n=1 Tax=Elysia marginata TaxID=1093978 RepID=A0AAV4FJN4_9GAST|nr:versican core protein [Elysia marginata]
MPIQYICQRQGTPIGTTIIWKGRCYELITNSKKTYNEASNVCRSYGGALASVTSWEVEYSIGGVLRDLQHYQDIWIGLNDKNTEGYYVWEDGSSYDYSHWAANQGPSNSFPDSEDCVAMDFTGEWHDYRCYQWGFMFARNIPPRLGFVCQYEAHHYRQPMPQLFKVPTTESAAYGETQNTRSETVKIYFLEPSKNPQGVTTEIVQNAIDVSQFETTRVLKGKTTGFPKVDTTAVPITGTTVVPEGETTEAHKNETTGQDRAHTTETP